MHDIYHSHTAFVVRLQLTTNTIEQPEKQNNNNGKSQCVVLVFSDLDSNGQQTNILRTVVVVVW